MGGRNNRSVGADKRFYLDSSQPGLDNPEVRGSVLTDAYDPGTHRIKAQYKQHHADRLIPDPFEPGW